MFIEIKKLTSDKKCTECSEILSKKSFRRGQGNICKPCMTNKVKERNRAERKNDLTFNNLNKWSPADIYLASSKGRMVLKQLSSGKNLTSPLKIGKSKISSLSSLVSFGVLNAVMKQLMENGDLLPLSLKKAPNKDSVIIKTINFFYGYVKP